jgi:hypothetical protein
VPDGLRRSLHAATTMAMSPAARRWPAALAWALAGLAVLALPPAIRLEQLLRAAGLPGVIPAGTAMAVAVTGAVASPS